MLLVYILSGVSCFVCRVQSSLKYEIWTTAVICVPFSIAQNDEHRLQDRADEKVARALSSVMVA